MNEEILEKYRQAGRIAKKVREEGIKMIKPGVKLLEVAEGVEKMIKDMGAEPAFPVNISINNVAAHFSPRFKDDHLEFRVGDVVKLDVGVHVDGYIADTAETVEVESDRYYDLILSSKRALEKVIEMVKPSVYVGELGKVISDTINSMGFKPIRNLSGHSLERYNLHAGISVPNIPTTERVSLKEGMVLAIEPFSSTGSGYVKSKGWSNIYRYIRSPLARDLKLKILATRIKKRFGTLPFADRWFSREFPNMQTELHRLISLRCVYHYPRLVDDGIVSQHEHTIIVTKDGCEVIT